MDAITSVWVIKRFLPGWENAEVKLVPAGERGSSSKYQVASIEEPIETINGNEVMHVDTGLGPLDHHQTSDDAVCAASRSWEYVKQKIISDKLQVISSEKQEAVGRMVKVVVGFDHFKEVFWEDATADYHEFNLLNILDGLKLQKPDQDEYYVDFVMQNLDAILHEFENRIWAEKEIAQNGIEFPTKYGKGIGFETINDSVIKLAQKLGYVLVLRKDPRKGYVRIKARPTKRKAPSELAYSYEAKELNAKRPLRQSKSEASYSLDADIDLTLAYENLKKIDPEATWFLHVSKKMLLNGSVKNPKMRPTKMTLKELIAVLEKV